MHNPSPAKREEEAAALLRSPPSGQDASQKQLLELRGRLGKIHSLVQKIKGGAANLESGGDLKSRLERARLLESKIRQGKLSPKEERKDLESTAAIRWGNCFVHPESELGRRLILPIGGGAGSLARLDHLRAGLIQLARVRSPPCEASLPSWLVRRCRPTSASTPSRKMCPLVFSCRTNTRRWLRCSAARTPSWR